MGILDFPTNISWIFVACSIESEFAETYTPICLLHPPPLVGRATLQNESYVTAAALAVALGGQGDVCCVDSFRQELIVGLVCGFYEKIPREGFFTPSNRNPSLCKNSESSGGK